MPTGSFGAVGVMEFGLKGTSRLVADVTGSRHSGLGFTVFWLFMAGLYSVLGSVIYNVMYTSGSITGGEIEELSQLWAIDISAPNLCMNNKQNVRIFALYLRENARIRILHDSCPK